MDDVIAVDDVPLRRNVSFASLAETVPAAGSPASKREPSPRKRTTPKKSTLKSKPSAQEIWRKVYAQGAEALAQTCITHAHEQIAVLGKVQDSQKKLRAILTTGANLYKVSRHGGGRQRYVWCTEDLSEICWGRPLKEKAARPPKKSSFYPVKSRRMDTVGAVRYGTHDTRRFNKYMKKGGKPWLAISLIFADRRLDFVCSDPQQATYWFLALQAASPVLKSRQTLGRVLWTRVKMKLHRRYMSRAKSRRGKGGSMLAMQPQSVVKSKERANKSEKMKQWEQYYSGSEAMTEESVDGLSIKFGALGRAYTAPL